MRSGSRMQFSDVTERLLGRSVSPSQAAAEAQADWDYEDTLSPAIRKAIASQRDQEETVDTYALAVAENAIKTMRAFAEPGSKYHGLAKALKNAIRVDPGQEYLPRINRLDRKRVV